MALPGFTAESSFTKNLYYQLDQYPSSNEVMLTQMQGEPLPGDFTKPGGEIIFPKPICTSRYIKSCIDHQIDWTTGATICLKYRYFYLGQHCVF